MYCAACDTLYCWALSKDCYRSLSVLELSLLNVLVVMTILLTVAVCGRYLYTVLDYDTIIRIYKKLHHFFFRLTHWIVSVALSFFMLLT